MLTLIFLFLLFGVFGKMIGVAIKAAWGITKIVCTLIMLPIFLIVLAVCGLVSIAIPILIVIGIISLVSTAVA